MDSRPSTSHAVQLIIFNSPALDSLKHQQLRSMCSRYGLKSTGKKDALLRRLKSMRDLSPSKLTAVLSNGDNDNDDGRETIDGQQQHGLQHEELICNTHEFGSFAGSSQVCEISKTSSWRSLKDIASRAFGGSSKSLASAASCNSLASRATVEGTCDATISDSTQTSLDTVVQIPGSMPSRRKSYESTRSVQSIAPDMTYEYRVVDNTMPNHTCIDESYIARPSLDGYSALVDRVQQWPPCPNSPAGVIFVSPCKSPLPQASHLVPTSAYKRRFEEFRQEEEDEEGCDETRLDGYFAALNTIRLVPPSANNPASPLNPATPGSEKARRIAGIPKRAGHIASRPPKFDGVVPPLPSFALALTIPDRGQPQDLTQQEQMNSDGIETQVPQETANPSSDDLITNDGPARLADSPVRLGAAARPPVFVFGTPSAAQDTASRDAFEASAQRMLGIGTREKMLEELNRRAGTDLRLDTSIFNKAGGAMFKPMPRSTSSTAVRFADHHEKEFAKMDSIAGHYAVKRSAPVEVPQKRAKIEQTSSTTLIGPSHDSLGSKISNPSRLGVPLAGSFSHRPSIFANESSGPPGPKPDKSAASKELDRERIRALKYGQDVVPVKRSSARPAGAYGSPRKVNAQAAGSRKLPPLAGSNSPNKIIARTTSTSSLFKKSFSSLRSLATTGSLSSISDQKIHVSQDASALLEAAPAAPTGPLRVPSTSTQQLGSFARPTQASLARTSSIGWLKQAPDVNITAKSSERASVNISPPQNRHVSAEHVLSMVDKVDTSSRLVLPSVPTTSLSSRPPIPPRTVKTHPSMLLPRQDSPKKRMSSISQAARSPGSGRTVERVSEAKKVHLKAGRLAGQKDEMARTGSPFSNTLPVKSPQHVRSPSGSVSSRGGSLNKPAWR